eukprot:Phypoly_transcript_13537.p1 GENE.Phypoly_transcript_13537~~Phypoly_transcript_13537.p1  ORF type:complete len:267 (+),score=40.48 Phypoly_transcript_13537:193-993(+)
MAISPLFPLDIHYVNSLGSAFDPIQKVIFLMATVGADNNFGFYTIDLNTNTTKTYELPAAILPFESTFRWISTTPDVVYIFSWKAAYTFSFADSTFQEFLNFSVVFENLIPENAQSPTPYYFDTNANILYCYFVYYGSNNQVEMTRIGVTMAGEVVDKESISCIPGHVPYFDTSNNNTYSILQITEPNDLYNFEQATTSGATCSNSKTIFQSPVSLECYLWDAENNRMLMGNFNFQQGFTICKYTNNVWDFTCATVGFQLEDIYLV